MLPNRLVFSPVAAVRSLRVLPPAAYLADLTLPPRSASQLPAAASSARLDIEVAFQPAPLVVGGSVFGLSVLGGAANVTIEVVSNARCGAAMDEAAALAAAARSACANLTVGPHSGPFLFDLDEPMELRVLVDASIVEAFAAGGRAAVTHRAYPATDRPLSVRVVNAGDAAVSLVHLEASVMQKAEALPLEALRRRATAQPVEEM